MLLALIMLLHYLYRIWDVHCDRLVAASGMDPVHAAALGLLFTLAVLAGYWANTVPAAAVRPHW